MLNKTYVPIYTITYPEGLHSGDIHLQDHPSSRATRLVDDTTRFLLVSVRKNVQEHVLKPDMQQWIREGLQIGGNRLA